MDTYYWKLCGNLTLPCNTFSTFLPPCLCSCHSRLLKGHTPSRVIPPPILNCHSSLPPAPPAQTPSPGSEPAQNKLSVKPQWFVAGIFFFFFNALALKQFPHLALHVHHLLGWALRSGGPPHQPATIYVTYRVALTLREGFPGKIT